jgi:hypothetical protein
LGDFDKDGDLDLYVANLSGANKLFLNQAGSANHWLHVNLVGTISNRSAIGARVRVVSGSLSQIREISGGSGYYSQNSLTAEFGLGSVTLVDTVEVKWPSGLADTLIAESVDRLITIYEGGQQSVCGDVNSDGAINLSDPICLANYYFGKPCAIDPWGSDVNCDTLTNLGDAIIIAQYYFGAPGFSLNCCP